MVARTDVNTAQSAAGVLLVRPTHFGHNAQTSVTNRFQKSDAQAPNTATLARAEFDALVVMLRTARVNVCVVEDSKEQPSPDAVFPNNWVSFHRDGTVVLYPMLAPNRRLERRTEVLAAVEQQLMFRPSRLLDLSVHELQGRYLEGTGSLVLDHVGRLAYACRSPRTDEALLRHWCAQMGFEAQLFDAHGADGAALYHTNVLMSIGSQWAVVCSEAIAQSDRDAVLQRLRSAHTVIEISIAAMEEFAGNILELRGGAPDRPSRRLLVLSARARAALQREPGDAWKRLGAGVDDVLVAPVPTIESVGGGGVRCMLAEVPEVVT